MPLTVNDAARRLGCSPQTVRNLIRGGRLPASRRLGTARGAWQITEEAFGEFLEATAEPEPAAGAAAKAPGAAA
jgi:excisionase family DNA binding protein